MSTVYEQSKRIVETEKNVCDILRWSGNSYVYKLEAGPAFTLDYALRIVKPDVFHTLSPELVKPKLCPQDPQVWWVVTTTPVCFGWKNGHCKNVVNTANGIYNKCKFRHEDSPYIQVNMVSTEMLLKKMKNRTKKLRENGTRNKKNFYINPFTGISYPCNYQQKGGKDTTQKIQDFRKNFLNVKTKMINEFNTNSQSFVKPNSFTTKWMIKQHQGLYFLDEIKAKEVVEEKEMNILELDEHLRSSSCSIEGKSWADLSDEDEDEDKVEEDDGWTTVVRKKKN